MPTISVLQTRSKEASEKKVVSSDGQVERNASEPKRKVEREVVKVKVSVEEFLNFQELFEVHLLSFLPSPPYSTARFLRKTKVLI